MKTPILAVALMCGLTTASNALESQPNKVNGLQHFIFSYDFNNLQDPTLRQTQHLLQELDYQLVRDIQQHRLRALENIEQQVANYTEDNTAIDIAAQYL